jgi:hypothetical protein
VGSYLREISAIIGGLLASLWVGDRLRVDETAPERVSTDASCEYWESRICMQGDVPLSLRYVGQPRALLSRGILGHVRPVLP